jgi:hypothetical protein
MRRAMKMTWLALALAVGVSMASATASADVSLLLPPEALLRTTFNPARLPAYEAKPISVALTEAIRNPDGSHPPALQELDLDLDRHLGLSVKGLPRCGPLLQESPTRQEPFARCDDAKVGAGNMKVEVAFPEQQPVQVSGRVSVYNRGVVNGRTGFLLHVYLSAPVTGSIVASLEVGRRVEGPYGWHGVLRVPKIANGAGSITYLGFRFRKGIFSASCPGKRLLTHGLNRFADGEVGTSTLIRTCKTAASS